MGLQEDDGLGSIRWSSDVFSEVPPSPKKRRRFIWNIALAAALLLPVLAAITAVKPATNDSVNPLQIELVPSSGGKNTVSSDGQRRKRRNPLTPVAGFPIASADAAKRQLRDEDFVIGVELEGEARAYPINMLGKPESELLNDTLAGRPIAVTFCATCQSPLVFSRQVEGQTLTLFLTGELLSKNMLMKDSETGSEWVQLTGEAIEGPLAGHRLEELSTVWTDWRTWRERHPRTTAPDLPRVVENYQHHPLYSAFAPERSFFSTLQWGVADGDKARSWPYAQLARQAIVNDTFAGRPILVLFDLTSSTPTAFDRRLDDDELTFRMQADGLTDDQTLSLWDTITGQALRGPLTGRQLRPVPGTVSLDWAWRNFHPDSEIWSAGAER
jgi:Protein of unknown function (DUF3179)